MISYYLRKTLLHHIFIIGLVIISCNHHILLFFSSAQPNLINKLQNKDLRNISCEFYSLFDLFLN